MERCMDNEIIIRELLELNDSVEIHLDDALEEYNFDSMASIGLITYLSEKSDIEIDPENLESLETIRDLDEFISEKTSP